jgi:hypothetical protein
MNRATTVPPDVLQSMFRRLPQSTRKKLNFDTDLKGIAGAVIIVDAIHDAYSQCSHVLTELRRKKRAHGYCGGEASCIAYVGGEGTKLCGPCRKLARERRENLGSKPKRPLSEYAKLRARMPAVE